MYARCVQALGTLALAALATQAGWAQDDVQKIPGPETRSVTSVDGWTLPLDYYHPLGRNAPPSATQNTPIVILLHGLGGNRQAWKDLAPSLQKSGFAVVAVDLRKHGESQPPPGFRGSLTDVSAGDYAAMANLDLPAIKQFLLVEHQQKRVNIRKTGIIAADKMVPVAMSFAVADWIQPPYPDAPTISARTPRGQDIRAFAMLSPSGDSGRLSSNQLARMLRNDAWMVAAWIGVGSADREDDGAAQLIYDRFARGNPAANEHVVLAEFEDVKIRGTELLSLRGANVGSQLVTFMNNNLKVLEAPWQSRISPLQK